MIDKISISGYQSLANVELELGKLTVITGHSDAGKSAIVRALEQAAFNDGGADCLSVFDNMTADKATVRFDLDGGKKSVSWDRFKSTVTYTYQEEGQEPKTFRKIGKVVPDDVVNALGMREVQIDTGSGELSYARVQFASQFDLPFLVADRGGVAAARVLGRLTGLHIFGSASKKAQDAGRILQTALTAATEETELLEGRLAEFEGIEEQIAALEAIQKELEQLEVHQARMQALKGVLERYKIADHQVADAASRFRPDILECLDADAELVVIIGQKLVLVRTVDGLVVRYRQAGALMEQVAASPVAAIEVHDISEMGNKLALVEFLRAFSQKLFSASKQVVDAETNCASSEAQVQTMESELKRIATAFPLCPFEKEFQGPHKGPYRCKDIMKVIQGNG